MALIDKFKASMKHGGARNNQFQVTLALPKGLTNMGASTESQIGGGDGDSSIIKASWHCRATNLPGQTLTEIPVSFRGRTVYLAGDRTFDDAWTTTFFNDADFKVRTMIERWMNGINDLSEAVGEVDPAQYQTNLHVHHLSSTNKVLKAYRFVSAWPTSISQIDLAAEQADAIETFDVTWRYMHFVTSGVGAEKIPVTEGYGSNGQVIKDNPNSNFA